MTLVVPPRVRHGVSNPVNDADLPLWRVGVVVFASVRAVDYTDGAHIVERAVEYLVQHGPRSVLLRPGMAREVNIAEVLELSIATGNGYTMLLPTTKAWRQYNNGESGGLPESIVNSFNPEDRDE